MAEWQSSWGGYYLSNARLLTEEEIDKRYPSEEDSFITNLTREAVAKKYDILYGVNPELSPDDIFQKYDNWAVDVLVTAAYLYKCTPDDIELWAFTDRSQPNAIYAAVKLKYT